MLQKFKHEEENIHKALCLEDDIRDGVREKIFFCTFSNALVVEELYDDLDDAPVQLKTVTGILEKAIGLATEKEYDLLLLQFHNFHELAEAAYKHYRVINDKNIDRELKTKMKILEMLGQLKDFSDDVKTEKLHTHEIMKRITLVKKSNYNFDKYMEMVYTISE